MACTTILVGKKASYDGSTMIARNDDSGSGHFTPKKFVVVQKEEQPRSYKSEISHVEIELPDDPMRYTAVPNAEYTPRSDDLPWCMVPERKVTVEDVKYMLSSHYQGTPYDPYAAYGDKSMRGAYRSIGINRNDFLAVIQMRPDKERDCHTIEWLAFASNAFNVLVPFYADVDETPEYLSNTTGEVSTGNFYWVSRLIAAMADASYQKSVFHVERYEEHVMSKGRELINRYDALLEKEADAIKRMQLKAEANEKIADMLKEAAGDTLDKVLFELSSQMKNSYSRSDA